MAEGPYGIGSTVWPGLAKVTEECGELLQLLGKIIARGGNLDHRWTCGGCGGTGSGMLYDTECAECGGRGYLGSGDLTGRLHEEIGDLMGALDFLINMNDEIDAQTILRRRGEKRETYERWHAERTVVPRINEVSE